MNYDYSQKEFELFIELYQMLKDYSADHPMDSGSQECAENIMGAIKILGQTPYFRFAMENVEGYNGAVTAMGAMEVVAAVSPSLYLSAEYSTRVLGRAIDRWGDENQKKRFLEPLLSGTHLGALALCEQTVNVDNEPLITTGSKQGSNVSISGKKQFVVNGPVAEIFGVVGIYEGKAAVFLVDKKASGLVIEEKAEALGYKGAAISGVSLEDCTIEESRVICCSGKEDMVGLLRLWENQALIGASLGLMRTAFESARDYAKSHRTGGKPIIAYQEIGFKLAEMLTLYQSSQLLATRAAWTLEKMPKEAVDLTLCAKVFCAESAAQVSGDAMKIMGSSAFFGSNPVEHAYCCARYAEIFGTSSELSRVKIGDAALGLKPQGG
jgi:alkylation response protein AidB-like acyl-CoA dehydrogenase